MQKCKLKCNRNCNNLMMQIRLAKKCNAGIANLPAAKKMQLGQGIAKKRSNHQIAKKMQCDRHSAKKKRCDRQKIKKSDGTGKVQKKSDGTGKVQKKCNCGQFVASRIWERQPTG